jgi:hypothetical protein
MKPWGTLLKNLLKIWGWRCGLVIKCFHSMYEALGLIPSTVLQKKKKNQDGDSRTLNQEQALVAQVLLYCTAASS